MRTARIGIVEHRADIAPVRIAAGQPHARPERIRHRHAKRQQQRPRPVVAARRVAILELKPKQHLRHVMAARGELIQDLLGGNELLLLQPVHLPAGQDQPRDLAPVHVCGNPARVAVRHGQASRVSTTAAINRSI